MFRYIIKRLLELFPTTLGIIVLTFILFHVIGSSPAMVVLGKNATAESIAAFNTKYGYDKPLLIGDGNVFDSQFFSFAKNLVKGDFGISTEYDEPVSEILKRGVGPSLTITLPILLGGTVIGISLALICAAFRGRIVDKGILMFSTVLMSVNYVIWVLLGQFVFAFKCGLFPIWGYESAIYVVLPVIIGIISSLGTDIRFFRTAILDEIYKPYVRTAYSKGLSHTRVLTRHVLRNALIPIVTYISLSIPFLFTGSLMLETFFGIPGLGNVSINAIHSADMAVVRAVVVLGALLYQIVNLFTVILYALLDPRVRLT